MEKHGLQVYSRGYSERVLLVALLMTAGMFVVELLGGILSNSLALVGDSGHMLMDSFALGVSVLAFRISRRPATTRRTYGYYRVEILAALANGILLVGLSFFIFYETYRRFYEPVQVMAPIMLWVSMLGLVVNFAAIYLLRGAKKENLNVKGAFLHVLGDAISSIGVITAAIIIYFTQASVVDSLMGILIGGIILRGAFGLLSESGKVLLEYVPEEIDVEDLVKEIKKIKGVRDVHDLHLWSISSGINAMSGHIEIEDQMVSKAEDIMNEITKKLEKDFKIVHTTLQLECRSCGSGLVCRLEEEKS